MYTAVKEKLTQGKKNIQKSCVCFKFVFKNKRQNIMEMLEILLSMAKSLTLFNCLVLHTFL